MYNFKTNSKSIHLTDDLFLLLKQINNLAFVTKPQIAMLYSIIQNRPVSITSRLMKSLTSTNAVLMRVSAKDKRNKTNQIMFVVSRVGRSFLQHFGVSTRDMRSFTINSHNLQANETLIQSLYAACFKSTALGLNNVSLAFNNDTLEVVATVGSAFSTDYHSASTNNLSILAAVNDAKTIRSHINYKFFDSPRPLITQTDLLNKAILVAGQYRTIADSKGLFNKNDSDKDTPLRGVENWGGEVKRLFSKKLCSYSEGSLQFYLYKDFMSMLERLFSKKLCSYSEDSLQFYLYKDFMSMLERFFSKKLCSYSEGLLCSTQIWDLKSTLRRILSLFFNRLFLSFNPQLALAPNTEVNTNTFLDIASLNKTDRTLNSFIENNVNNSYGDADDPFDFYTPDPSIIFKPIGTDPFIVDNDLEQQVANTALMINSTKKHFDLEQYDIRPFNNQLDVDRIEKSPDTNTPFEADTMISFKQNGKQYRVFIELDNRTEGNLTQRQKFINYLYYAQQKPNEEILLAMVSTDGSLPSEKVKGFKYPDAHLGYMAQKILNGTLGNDVITDNGELIKAPRLKRDAYDSRPNLHVIFAGVSEAPKRIAEYLIGSNHNADYYANAVNLAKILTEKTAWTVTFEPTESVISALKNPDSFFDLSNDDTSPKFEMPKIYGTFEYKSDENDLKLYQSVIAGDEYDIETVDTVSRFLEHYDQHVALKDGDYIPPMVIYPTREDKRHPLNIPNIQQRLNWQDKFIVGQVYYYQPRLGVDNNPYLLRELRNLATHYSKDIYNYFRTGYLTKYDAAKDIKYGLYYLPIRPSNIVQSPRTYGQLKDLARQLSPNDFVNQLMLTEIPMGIFQKLITRTQGLEFSIPIISKLPYADSSLEDLSIEQHIDLDKCITTPNSLVSTARKHIPLTYL